MLLLPLPTRLLRPNDALVDLILHTTTLQDGDIIVVSSKAVATTEGSAIDLRSIVPSDDAVRWSRACGQDPRFTQAVMDEADRMHGHIERACPVALLTSLRPTGMEHGRILCPNAGLDQSNVAPEHAIGWPRDPVQSVRALRDACEEGASRVAGCPVSVAVILSDSCCRPGRIGVTAFALTVCGLSPLKNRSGEHDLFGRTLRVTQEAVADQLATAANAVMGNAAESIPAVIIRDHHIPLDDFCGWVPGIDAAEDIFLQ